MDPPVATSSKTAFRTTMAVAVIGFCAFFGWQAWERWPSGRHTEQPALATSAAPVVSKPATATAPSFDIVRVSPSGGLVAAGRAEPNSTVTLKRGDTVIAEVQADERGAWVAVPTTDLAPGNAELVLSSRNAAGTIQTAPATAIIVLPQPQTAGQPQPAVPALALLSTPAAPTRLLQAPPGGELPGKLALGAVDYDDQGAIRFSGTAPPGSTVRVYVDNRATGDATASDGGEWTLTPNKPVQPGMHRLRVDQLSDRGRVARRVEFPFERETLAVTRVGRGQVMVEPGQNLWLLAQRAYGTGLRYTVIYAANRSAIRDERRIYPGQVFTLPGLQR